MTSSIRGWMRLKYVAATYRAPQAALIAQFELPPQTDPDTSLKALPDHTGVAPAVYVQRVQHVIAMLSPAAPADRSNGNSSWLGAIDKPAGPDLDQPFRKARLTKTRPPA